MVLRARRGRIAADRMARDVRPDQGPIATARRGSPRSNGETAKASPSKPRAKPGDALAQKLARLGVSRDEDLVLHLPLRYEDRTRLTPLADLRAGDTAQAEGTVVRTDVQYRPRRQLVCLLEDERDGHRARLVLRFFSFYPSQQKALAPRQPRARVRRGARRPFRARDRASGISHRQRRHAASRPPDTRVSDHRWTWAGDVAQGGRARARRRSAANRGTAPGSVHAPPRPVEVRRRRALSSRAASAPVGADPEGARRAHPSCMDASQVRGASCAAAFDEGASEGARRAACPGPHRHRQAHERASRARAVRAHAGAGTRVA